MNSKNYFKNIVRSNLCISCGLCKMHGYKIEYNPSKGKYLPTLSSEVITESSIPNICPGNGYNIKQLANVLFGEDSTIDYFIGRFKHIYVGTSNDKEILENASSGGLMTGIAWFLLENNHVDEVISTKFEYTKHGPMPVPYFAKNKKELLLGQGSKYAPTKTLELLERCQKDKKYLLIGTPCQIAGLRILQERIPIYKQMIPYTMANFCGGYRDIRDQNNLIKLVAKCNPEEVTKFRYRGGGQPGSMLIENKSGSKYEYPYPQYGGLSILPKTLRCDLCIDGTGELADFALGDAWLKKYKNDTVQRSILICRSTSAELIFNEALKKNYLWKENEEITASEVFESQTLNLTSKKIRQKKRTKLYKTMGQRVPKWDQELRDGETSYLKELKIIISKIGLELKYRLFK